MTLMTLMTPITRMTRITRLGLRLAVGGGREAVLRLVTIAAAVALGVGLLLATLAGVHAVEEQNARYAWLNSGAAPAPDPGREREADPAWWLLRRDHVDGRAIARVDVAATGPHSPVPPGIAALPGPGQFYASPELGELLASTPAAELADRFPGRQVGTIGDAALPSPDSLVVVVGRAPGELAHLPDAAQVTSIATTVPGDCGDCVIGADSAAMALILSVVAGALLFPVLIFTGTATRLAATRREQRFAAMRLVGATPRQVSVLSAVESGIAAAAGTLAGFGLFAASRGPLAAVPFTGAPFFPGDLSLGVADVVLVALGVPAGAVVAARIALRRVRISPLGITRQVTPRAPRPYRLIPLVAGIAELAYVVGRVPDTAGGQVAAFLPGFLLIMVGLVIAGPWLTMVGARVMARRATRPAALIAARRLADNPRAGFRAVSGLVLALFVTSVAVGVITTIVANRGIHRGGTAATGTLSRQFWPGDADQDAATATHGTVAADLRSIPGVREVTVVRHNPDQSEESLPGLVACADLARVPALGRCERGVTVAQIYADLARTGPADRSPQAWPDGVVSAEELRHLPVLSIVVSTDGSASATERARTALEVAFPRGSRPPSTEAEVDAEFTQTLRGWQRLADVVILASLPIAGCSLAVSLAGGLSERRRPFSLLRLSGVPLRVLRRVVALESAVPLLAVAAVAIAAGFLAAHLFLTAQLDYPLRAPGAGYHLTVLAGLAASLGIIASTLPFLERVTGPDTARND